LKEQNIKNAEHYGYKRQSQQAIEECSELIQAISKYNRLLNGEYVGKEKKIIANLIEELADVEICIEQLKYFLEVSDTKLDNIKQFKIKRTSNIINGNH
jgi:NTP pyrophosphatase (non-canonical NTP hydrolase)